MIVGTVREVWRYPVKSMRGERLEAAQLGERGIAGDRVYALRDAVTGKFASAKRPRLWGALLQCVARTDATTGAVSITLPDGRQVTAGQDDVNAAFATLTGRAVALVDEAPERPEIERYWPDVEGLALRDMVTSNVIALGAPAGGFFDFAPLHLLTTSSLATLAALYPSGHVDRRRFRPNFFIEAPDDARGFMENDWVGRTILVGREVRLRITNPVPRCVVPTLPQDDLREDIGILRAIAEHNRPVIPARDDARLPALGVYASVEREGVVAPGDVVRVVDG